MCLVKNGTNMQNVLQRIQNVCNLHKFVKLAVIFGNVSLFLQIFINFKNEYSTTNGTN